MGKSFKDRYKVKSYILYTASIKAPLVLKKKGNMCNKYNTHCHPEIFTMIKRNPQLHLKRLYYDYDCHCCDCEPRISCLQLTLLLA